MGAIQRSMGTASSSTSGEAQGPCRRMIQGAAHATPRATTAITQPTQAISVARRAPASLWPSVRPRVRAAVAAVWNGPFSPPSITST